MPSYQPGYWQNHPEYRWKWNSGRQNWWTWATSAAVAGWLVNKGVSLPVYFDYGTNVYTEGDDVYYNGKMIGTTEEFTRQAQEISQSVPEVDPNEVNWLPLGVFALTEKTGSIEDSTFFLQMAITQEGIIAGTFQNTALNNSFEVEGAIDPKTQRAAWSPVGESWPIVETGIYNLTENEASVLVYFEDGRIQQWTMVRLDEPNDRE